MLQKSLYYPSQEFYWEISFLYCFGAIKDIYLFCNICNSNRTECKPLPIFMNSSNSKYTRMIHQVHPLFHSCFQSRVVYIIWQWVSILWFRYVQTRFYTGKEIIQAVCCFMFISYKFIIINKSNFFWRDSLAGEKWFDYFPKTFIIYYFVYIQW